MLFLQILGAVFISSCCTSGSAGTSVAPRRISGRRSRGPNDVVVAFVSAIETEESVDEEDDPRVKEATAIAASQPPRQAFSKLNAKLPVKRRHKKLGEVTQPIGADVYDAPWLESEDDEEEDVDEDE